MAGLRVLEAITPSRIGGAEVLVANLCRALQDRGAHVDLFCPSGRPFVQYVRERGLASVNWRTRGKLDLMTLMRLARLMRANHCDVIHTHLSTASLLGALAAKLVRGSSVAHVHGLNTATCFRYSDVVIAVSEAVKRHLVAQGLDERKVQVVHNGVDLSSFRPTPTADARLEPGLPEDAPVFGLFGRLSQEKGQRVAVEAMFLLTAEHPDARLLVVGDGPDREELARSAEALGIAGSVVFPGFVEDVRGLMCACDVVLAPSLKEGFGLAAVEAMALERPVIASDVGGLPEIVVPGETGMLVPPNDPRGLAEAMEAIISDGALARSMGEAGRARAEQHFEFGRQVDRVLQVLQQVAA